MVAVTTLLCTAPHLLDIRSWEVLGVDCGDKGTFGDIRLNEVLCVRVASIYTLISGCLVPPLHTIDPTQSTYMYSAVHRPVVGEQRTATVLVPVGHAAHCFAQFR